MVPARDASGLACGGWKLKWKSAGGFGIHSRGRASRPCWWAECGGRVQWRLGTGKKGIKDFHQRNIRRKVVAFGETGDNFREKKVCRYEMPARHLRGDITGQINMTVGFGSWLNAFIWAPPAPRSVAFS